MSDSLCVGTKKQKDFDMLGCFGGMFDPSKDFNCENCDNFNCYFWTYEIKLDNKKVLFAFMWMSSPSNLMTVLFGLWQPTFFFFSFGHLGVRSVCCETKCAVMVKQSSRILNAQLIISNLEGKKRKKTKPQQMEQETSSQDLWKKELGREKERERVV